MTELKIASYGTWASPITADRVAEGGIRLTEPLVEGDTVTWCESRPSEGGRGVVVRADPWSDPTDVTPPGFYVRDKVHEYGGGAYVVHAGVVVFANFQDQRLYRQDPGSAPVPITPEPESPGADRYADMSVSSDGGTIACVREHHAGEGLPVNEIVLLPTDGSAAPVAVASGRDFYACPRFSPDGARLSWMEWDMPRMPWDGTELVVADLDGPRAIRASRPVAGGPTESRTFMVPGLPFPSERISRPVVR